MSSPEEATWTLPRTWEWTTAGDVAQVIGGGTPDTKVAENFGGVIPWVTPADMSTHVGKMIAGGSRSLTEKGLAGSGAKWLPEGTVLFSSRAPIGYTAIASKPVTTNQGFKSFVPESCITSDYLYHWLASSKERAEKLASGTTFLEISGAKAALIPVPVAPLSEQARIVEKLEELLSDLDAGVAELKAAQRKLAQYRQSLLKAAVEGALTADWRAANGQPQETGAELLQRILSERRARWEQKQLAKFAEQGKAPPVGWQTKYAEPVAPDFRDLHPLPDGWAWATAEQLCDFITKGTTPPKSMDDGSEKSVPFLRVTNLTNTGGLNFSDKAFVSRSVHEGFLARSIVYPNDVLMNIVGPPLGQVSIVPSDFEEWNVNQAIAIFRAVAGVMPAYVSAYLLSPPAQRWLKKRAKTTAGQTNLTLEVCRELPVPLPATQEQQAVTEQLDAQLASLQDQLKAVDHGLRQTAAQRKNLLKAAFTGQLVPQDPNDEPASALLARIRAEREGAPKARTRRGAGSNPAHATHLPRQGRRGRKPKETE